MLFSREFAISAMGSSLSVVLGGAILILNISRESKWERCSNVNGIFWIIAEVELGGEEQPDKREGGKRSKTSHFCSSGEQQRRKLQSWSSPDVGKVVESPISILHFCSLELEACAKPSYS